MKNPVEFKVGDLVYVFGCNKIGTVREIISKDCIAVTNLSSWFNSSIICHATQENYERLSLAFSNIEFEPPPKPKEPKDVIQAIINSNHKFIACINKSVDVEKHPLDGMGVFSAHTLKTINYEKLIGELIPFELETGKVIVDFVDGKPVLESGNE